MEARAAVETKAKEGWNLHATFHAVAALLFFGEGFALVRGVLDQRRHDLELLAVQSAEGGCPYPQASLPDRWVVLAGIAALAAGAFFGRRHYSPESERQPQIERGEQDGHSVTGQVALAFLYAALAVVFIAEAIGVARFNGHEPITYYVRCAVGLDKQTHGFALVNMVVVGSLCFMLGSWFWPWFTSQQRERRNTDWHTRQSKDAGGVAGEGER